MAIKMIVGMDKNGLIGLKGKLPWEPIRADMEHFKKLTLDTTPGREKKVVMGPRTYASLPKNYRPLPHRITFVLTSRLDLEIAGVTIVSDAKILIDRFKNEGELWVMGGKEIYSTFEPVSKEMYITRVDAEFGLMDPDLTSQKVYFPEYDKTGWEEQRSSPLDFIHKGDNSPYNLKFIKLVRRHPLARV